MASQVVDTINKDNVEALRDHVVQDYLRLLLSRNYRDREWVVPYRELLKKNKSGDRKVSYEAPYDKLVKVGEANFTVSNMDVNIIHNLLSHEGNRNALMLSKPGFPVNAYLKAIVDDRNVIRAHSSSDEQQFDLLLGSLIILEHLHRFVIAVSKDKETLTNDQRESFLAMWDAPTLELVKDVRIQFEDREFDQAMDKVIEEDVKWAMSHQNPQHAFERLDEEYASRWRNSAEAFFTVFRLRKAASNAGSYCASSMLADTYFKGDTLLSIEPDYNLAGIYYVRAMRKTPKDRRFSLESKLNLASILINGLCDGYSCESGAKLLASVEEELPQNLQIEQYERDGYKFYRIEKIALSDEETRQRKAQQKELERREKEAYRRLDDELKNIYEET